MPNTSYVVHGNMAAEKSSEAYPTKTLCDDCVSDYEVLTKEGPSNEPCEDCGSDGDEDEE